MPPRNAVGTNTAHSTSAIETSALPTSSIVLSAASRRLMPSLEMPLDVFDHHDRVVDHDADRQHEAEQREIVDRESERRHHGESADQRHRDGDDRNDRRAPSLQEHQHDDDDQHHRLVDGLDQFADGLRDELGRIVADIVVQPLGEIGLHLRHRIGDVLGRGERIRSRPLRHQQVRPPTSAAESCWWCRTSAPSSIRATSRSRTVRPSLPALMTISSNCLISFRRPVKVRFG